MTADRDYYSGAFLDWFQGNIQHFSIACVLQCPPAAQQQYNETSGRAEHGIRNKTLCCTLLTSMWGNSDFHNCFYASCVPQGKQITKHYDICTHMLSQMTSLQPSVVSCAHNNSSECCRSVADCRSTFM